MNTFYLGKQFTSIDDRLLISQEHRTTAWSLLKGTLLSQYIFPPIVTYSFLGVVETNLLSLWLVLHLVLNTFRLYFIYFWFPSSKHINKHKIFDFGVLFSSFLSSLLWVYMMFYIDPSISPEHTVFYYVVIFGLSSGAIGVGICWPIYFVNYISILLLGFVTAVLLQYTQVNFILVLSIFAYMGFLVHICFTLNEKSAENIIVKIRNAELANNFDEQRAYANNLVQEKNHLLATTSHDLRQPLQAMIFFIASLKKKKFSIDEHDVLVDRLDRSVKSMSDLLSSMLDISKLDANAVECKKKSVSLQSILSNLYENHSMAAKNKGIEFSIQKSSDFIFSDPFLCERLLSNVLSNAIKYTESGSIHVTHKVNKKNVCINISDTGKGIPIKDHHRIFDDFIQLDNPERDKAKGLGLGLSIVKRIAALLSVEISLSSDIGVGTNFSLTFERGEPSALPQESREKTSLNKVKGKTILVIDDERDILFGIQKLLTRWGAEVICCESIDQALEKLEVLSISSIDVVISDYRLRDGKNGVDAIEKIKAYYPYNNISCFLLSGDTSTEHLKSIKDLGYYILHKPIQALALRSVLQERLKL